MKLSDEVLVRHTVTQNDSEAFAVLVRRYQARILLLQRRLVGEASLAEDLTQETFLRAWQKLGTFKASGSFGGWLARLGYNVFLQHYRRHKKYRHNVSMEATPELPHVESDDAELADLDRLLGMLEREEQIMLVLNYACGLTNAEVGEVLGMPTGTVKARIHRAKASIRANLQTPGGTPPITAPAAPPSGPETPVTGSTAGGRSDRGSTAPLTGAATELIGAMRA